MISKKLIPAIFMHKAEPCRSYSDRTNLGIFIQDLALDMANRGADAIIVFDLSDSDFDHYQTMKRLQKTTDLVQIPIYIAGNVEKIEDVRKCFSAGAEKVIINMSEPDSGELLREASRMFGRDRIAASVTSFDAYFNHKKMLSESGAEVIFMNPRDIVSAQMMSDDISCILVIADMSKEEGIETLQKEGINAIASGFLNEPGFNFVAFRRECLDLGIHMNVLESSIPFSEFKTDANGLVPVIVQDYKTGENLMLAYMNEESYGMTLEIGKMVYYSRSRQKLWLKGETSGHFQYVKSMTIDCDKDTILAKVAQVGPACHTGNPTCFFTPLFGKDYDEKNPIRVLNSIMDIINNRKGDSSTDIYSNYLMNRGLDQILKKVGEETAEMIVAAKNTDLQDLTYEISDLVYHIMVLMAVKGIKWDDIVKELSRR